MACKMGGDCCGNTTPATPAEPVAHVAQSIGNGTADANGQAAKFQEDFSPTEFKQYCKKRVDLFLKYKERQDSKVRRPM